MSEKKETLEPTLEEHPITTSGEQDGIAALSMEIQNIKAYLEKGLNEQVGAAIEKALIPTLTPIIEHVNAIEARLGLATAKDANGNPIKTEVIQPGRQSSGNPWLDIGLGFVDALQKGNIKIGGGAGSGFEKDFATELMQDMGTILKLNAKEMLYSARKRVAAIGLTEHLEFKGTP
jgi:hypothetical protein